MTKISYRGRILSSLLNFAGCLYGLSSSPLKNDS
nr:MAG TPA_asm: hypothetical protein [Caudoviricetes sp.]DAO50079.1 MAG TPA: hypothetical protein [Caudoviricetes sp.]DAQ20137.1 MAG TPA: hypothetical protein [Caudoviricetes sp.]